MKCSAGKLVFILLITAAMAACSIKQQVKPVQLGAEASKEICIIENPAVRAGFVAAYRNALEKKGYIVRMMPVASHINICETTTTYTARWSWDMAIYMSFAEINVFHKGSLLGQALYDSRGGGARLDKFIDGETKVGELVDHLFPGA